MKRREVTSDSYKDDAMKVQDFAYHVAARTIEMLEETQHYKVPEELRKQVTSKILDELDELIKKAK